jgi:AsmA protein
LHAGAEAGKDAAKFAGWGGDMKPLKIAGAVAAVAAIAIVLLLAIGIPASFVTSAIQARVERDTGYKIEVGGAARVSLLPGLSVTLHDVTVRNPSDRDTDSRVTIGSIRAELPLGSVISGNPQVTELTLGKPVLHVPLLRDRSRAPAARPVPAASNFTIDRVTIEDGAVVFANARDNVESRLAGIDAVIRSGSDRRVSATGKARLADYPLTFEIKATLPPTPLERQTIPVELKLDAPGLLKAQLTARAETRLNGSVLQINGLSGALGEAQFNGWASADLASKPLLKLDLDFLRLDIASARTAAPANAAWSDAPIDLAGLNYLDAQLRLSAAELNIGEARFAPAAIDARLADGAMTAQFSRLGVYGGQADGELGIDASSRDPSYALRGDLNDVRALPLLSGLAEFDKLDGKMQAKIAVKSSGTSQRAIMSNLSGTAFATFKDGEIRGLNVARMIRSLTASTLSGWQEGKSESTDLSQLSASFRIEQGQATTADLVLVGPLVRMTGTGTIDLGKKSLAFRVEPKLVMTTQGQGAAATDPVGFGVPVAIQGPWAEPRIFPDMAGILDNPDAAYAKLREMGKGLFGTAGGAAGTNPLGGAGGSNPLGGALGDTLGKLIQQGLGGQGVGGQGLGGQGLGGQGLGGQGLGGQGLGGQGLGGQGTSGDRSAAPQPQAPAQQPPSQSQNQPRAPDSDAAMNAIMKQLFGR